MVASVLFRSDDLPAELSNSARISLWRDLFVERFGECDAYCDPDRQFSVQTEFATFGDVWFSRFEGTIDQLVRTRRQIAKGTSGDLFFIGFNCGTAPALIAHQGREALFEPGHAIFINGAEPTKTLGPTDGAWAWVNIGVSRKHLLSIVPDAEDLVMTPFDSQEPVLRHLRRYLGILQAESIDDPVLTRQVGRTLLDLVVLSLDAKRDAAEIVRHDGLRAVRLKLIVQKIKAGFSDPAFSSERIANELHISRRYVNKILHETGQGFAERVLELRLRKAHQLLTGSRARMERVIDIALACGFNEISYFNRRFRARFGYSPSQCRAAADRTAGRNEAASSR